MTALRDQSMRAIRIVIAVGVWGGLAWFFAQALDGMPSVEQWQHLMSPPAIAAMGVFAGLFTTVAWLRTVRWRGLLPDNIGRQPGLFGVYCWSFLVTAIAPFRSGELLRPGWVRRQGGSFIDALGGILSERLADLVLLGGMLLLAITQAPAAAVYFDMPFPAAAKWAGPAFIGFFVLLHCAVTIAANRLHRRPDVDGDHGPPNWLGALLNGLRRAARPMAYVRLMGLTMMIWTGLALGYVFILTTLIPELHWSAGVGALALTNLAGLLWISPGNLGLYEAAVMLVLTAHGVAPEAALATAVVLHAVVLILTGAVGVIGRLDMIRRGASPTSLV